MNNCKTSKYCFTSVCFNFPYCYGRKYAYLSEIIDEHKNSCKNTDTSCIVWVSVCDTYPYDEGDDYEDGCA